MTGIRVTNRPTHGMSVRRAGDAFRWTCRCGWTYTHPVTEKTTIGTLAAHMRDIP